jgi:hypothetical protein
MKNAVMPLNDYVSACDKVREKADRIIIDNKAISTEFPEILASGKLIIGEQYEVRYTNDYMGQYDIGGINTVSNINVPNVGDVIGIIFNFIHLVFNITISNYIYQDGEKLMFYSDSTESSSYISLTKVTGKIVSGEMPEKIEEVYEVGKEQGSSEYWDLFQNYGNRNYYADAFRQTGFEYIRPKYKVIPTAEGGAVRTFYDSDKLKKIEAQYFDFSQMTKGRYSSNGFYNTFTTCDALEEIEDVGLQGQKYWSSTFNFCEYLKKIARIGVEEDTVFDAAFNKCTRLEDITFDGIIAQNGLSFSSSPLLTEATLRNVVGCLKDFSGTSETCSITFHADSVAKLETLTEGGKTLKQIANDKGWTVIEA